MVSFRRPREVIRRPKRYSHNAWRDILIIMLILGAIAVYVIFFYKSNDEEGEDDDDSGTGSNIADYSGMYADSIRGCVIHVQRDPSNHLLFNYRNLTYKGESGTGELALAKHVSIQYSNGMTRKQDVYYIRLLRTTITQSVGAFATQVWYNSVVPEVVRLSKTTTRTYGTFDAMPLESLPPIESSIPIPPGVATYQFQLGNMPIAATLNPVKLMNCAFTTWTRFSEALTDVVNVAEAIMNPYMILTLPDPTYGWCTNISSPVLRPDIYSSCLVDTIDMLYPDISGTWRDASNLPILSFRNVYRGESTDRKDIDPRRFTVTDYRYNDLYQEDIGGNSPRLTYPVTSYLAANVTQQGSFPEFRLVMFVYSLPFDDGRSMKIAIANLSLSGKELVFQSDFSGTMLQGRTSKWTR